MDNSINQSEKREFLGVWIPKDIYLNKDLSWMEKIILIEVTSFSENGKCFATNQYFAEFLGISASRVRHIIADLVKKGYLNSKIIYKKNSKQVEKRILSVSSTTPPAKSSRTPMVENSHTPPAKSSHYNNIIDNNIDKNNITISKYRDTYKYQNNKDLLSISIKQSMVSPQTTQKGWFEYLDISNNAMLLSELDKIQYFQKDDPKYDYLYTVFSTFADEFIKHRGYKHKEISCIDLNKMSTKLSSFVQKEYIPETDEYVVKNPHKFSIYEYEKDDLVWMVKDYFEYQFDDCDYSLWHFMSDNVLSARFWRMENRRTESVI